MFSIVGVGVAKGWGQLYIYIYIYVVERGTACFCVGFVNDFVCSI